MVFLFTIPSLAFTQRFSSEVFHKGFVVTNSRDTLKGSLKYDLTQNSISILSNGKVKSYSSHNVFYFEIFDSILNNYRQFYSLPFTVSYNYKTPVFFELIFEGQLSLMVREAIVQKQINNTGAYWGGGGLQNVLEYSFYFLDQNGKIQFFSGRKKDLFQIMNKKTNELKKYIKDNRLDTNDMRDLIRLTSFYNSLA